MPFPDIQILWKILQKCCVLECTHGASTDTLPLSLTLPEFSKQIGYIFKSSPGLLAVTVFLQQVVVV